MKVVKWFVTSVMVIAVVSIGAIGVLIMGYHMSADGISPLPSDWAIGADNKDLTAYYPGYLPTDCQETLLSLDKGTLRLDPNSTEVIGLNPRWKRDVERTGYFNFYLHSLRFVECMIKEGEAGNDLRLNQAKSIILNWLEQNPKSSPASQWSWTEHATAWRSVVLAYFLHTARHHGQLSKAEEEALEMAVMGHAEFVQRPSVYRPDHNHGLNNALALIALALIINDPAIQQDLLKLGFERAVQQMEDNVSADGVHLEQSGFYQFYTVRTFLEIYRLARQTKWPLPDVYQKKLAMMIEVASCMAGQDGKVDGLPYSKPREMVTNIFDLNTDLVHDAQLVLDRNESIHANATCDRLSVYPEGGYSFFSADEEGDLEVIFHTRILDAPHGHRDAMGITARTSEGPLISYTSTMYTSEKDVAWKKYFLGSTSHNGVTVAGLEQQPLNRRKPGLLATIADSYKLNSWFESIDMLDEFTALRRHYRLDRRTLHERSVTDGGEVLAYGSSGVADYVTARNRIYENVEHIRTVARIDGRLLLVWDRLTGKQAQLYIQRFHFMPDIILGLKKDSGDVTHNGRVVARIRQLMPVSSSLCRGELQPERCGWYTDSPSFPQAAPELLYKAQGSSVEFLWALQLGAGELNVQLMKKGSYNNRVLLVGLGNALYNVQLSGNKVTVKQASEEISQSTYKPGANVPRDLLQVSGQ